MNVFADLHHSGLFYSLKLLFEDRLGYNLYRPVGVEWFEEGYWDIAKPYNNNLDTVHQFLLLRSDYKPADNTPPLNHIVGIEPTHYNVDELAHGYIQKAITFKQFLDMDIDIIIASIPDHWITYTKLRDKYKPKARVICQMGNMFSEVKPLMASGIVDNLMASTIELPTPTSVNSVFYHQEQPVKEFVEPPRQKKIVSLVNLLPEPELFYQYKGEFAKSGFELKSYGASCPDGFINTLPELYQTIQDCDFVYHNKPRGDGYGWVFHSAFMLGRAVITNFNDYKDKLGSRLLEGKKTAINMALNSVVENVNTICGIYNDKKTHLTISREASNRFKQVVDYNQEEQKLRSFISRLKVS